MAGETILIVEDNPDNLELTRAVLSGEGYDVRTAVDADEALRAVREAPPDLILMDVQLPGVDGLELTRRLKEDPATRHIAVVAQTAYAMKGDEERALGAGCDGYLSKPFPIQTLLDVVSRHLRRGAGV